MIVTLLSRFFDSDSFFDVELSTIIVSHLDDPFSLLFYHGGYSPVDLCTSSLVLSSL